MKLLAKLFNVYIHIEIVDKDYNELYNKEFQG